MKEVASCGKAHFMPRPLESLSGGMLGSPGRVDWWTFVVQDVKRADCRIVGQDRWKHFPPCLTPKCLTSGLLLFLSPSPSLSPLGAARSEEVHWGTSQTKSSPLARQESGFPRSGGADYTPQVVIRCSHMHLSFFPDILFLLRLHISATLPSRVRAGLELCLKRIV